MTRFTQPKPQLRRQIRRSIPDQAPASPAQPQEAPVTKTRSGVVDQFEQLPVPQATEQSTATERTYLEAQERMSAMMQGIHNTTTPNIRSLRMSQTGIHATDPRLRFASLNQQSSNMEHRPSAESQALIRTLGNAHPTRTTSTQARIRKISR